MRKDNSIVKKGKKERKKSHYEGFFLCGLFLSRPQSWKKDDMNAG